MPNGFGMWHPFLKPRSQSRHPAPRERGAKASHPAPPRVGQTVPFEPCHTAPSSASRMRASGSGLRSGLNGRPVTVS